MLPPFLKGAPKMSINYVLNQRENQWMEPLPDTPPHRILQEYNQTPKLPNMGYTFSCMICTVGTVTAFMAGISPYTWITLKITGIYAGASYLYGRCLYQSNRSHAVQRIEDYVAKNGWSNFTPVTPPPGSPGFVVNIIPCPGITTEV